MGIGWNITFSFLIFFFYLVQAIYYYSDERSRQYINYSVNRYRTIIDENNQLIKIILAIFPYIEVSIAHDN